MLKRLRQHPVARAAGPWLALLALNLLFIAPGVALEAKKNPGVLLAPSGDLLILIAIAIASMSWKHGRWVRRATLAAGIVAWIYLWDELIARSIIYQNPPLYDQAFLIRHFAVLIFDLWSWKVALGLLGGALGLVLVVLLARALLRAVLRGVHEAPRKVQIAAAAVIALTLGVGTMLDNSRKTPRR
ncbi:MAG: hypothetical protein AAGA54_30830, partial [Myxococcota bacterium]